MTVPATGAPDWQSYTAWHSAMLIDASFNIPANAFQGLGQFDTSSFQGLHLRVRSDVNGGELFVSGIDGSSNIQTAQLARYVVRPETEIDVSFPNPCTAVEVSAQAQAGAAWDLTVVLRATNVAVDRHTYFSGLPGLYADNVLRPPGGPTSHYPLLLMPGPAHLWVFNSAPANPLLVSIRERNLDGTPGVHIAQYLFSVLRSNEDLIIPHRSYVVEVSNTGAANTNYYFGLVTKGMQ